jgi:hypothetical protein
VAIRKWFGFENEDREASSPAEYAAFDEELQLSPTEEREHGEFVARVGDEYGFPLSNWLPTIPSRART